MNVLAIDLEHLGGAGAICAYVIPGAEPAIVDPGPVTTLETLERKLAEQGIRLSDLRHVLLTHVHLDHAGATGRLARLNPNLQVHVHEEGAPHMADPERLVASTRRTFGEAHDRLWGEVLPVPTDRIRAWRPGERTLAGGARGALGSLRPIPTPGHIGHHVAYLDETDGTLFAGDSVGIVLASDAPTHPPTPPPAIDLEAWRSTLDRLLAIAPERAAPTHFGIHGRVEERIGQLASRLDALEARVRGALDREDEGDPARYEEEVRSEQSDHLPRAHVDRYFDVFPAATDWAGVERYIQKRRKEEG